jgi:glycosyltransferase involved in cell wall biosynthesis
MRTDTTKPETILIGPIPPPFGGISVHVLRLKSFLESTGETVSILDYTKRGTAREVLRLAFSFVVLFLRLKIKWLPFVGTRPSVIHVHISAARRYLIWGFLFRMFTLGEACVLTVHSGRIVGEIRKMGLTKKSFVSWLFRGFDKVIAVSEEQRDTLKEGLGIPIDRMEVIPAFIPPSEVPTKRRQPSSAPPVIAACGLLDPVYGYDVLLNAVELLREKEFQFKVNIVSYGVDTDRYGGSIKRRCESLGVHMINSLPPDEFINFLSGVDIFVRPSLVDGDANSLREAHWAGARVVASDCVKRPEWARLFPTGDAESLADCLAELLATRRNGAGFDQSGQEGERVKAVYREILSSGAKEVENQRCPC